MEGFYLGSGPEVETDRSKPLALDELCAWCVFGCQVFCRLRDVGSEFGGYGVRTRADHSSGCSRFDGERERPRRQRANRRSYEF